MPHDRDRAVWTRAWLGPDQPVHLLSARFVHHHYVPHAHEEFAIGVCSSGVETIRYRGTHWTAGPGTVVVIEPGEPHTGGPAVDGGFAYRAAYPRASLLSETWKNWETSETGDSLPHFRTPVIDDPALAAALGAAHHALSRGGDRLAVESTWIELLGVLVRRHATTAERPSATVAARRIATATMERLADQLVNPPSLAHIAAELGVSRFQVVRGFRDAVGMPPYAWLAQHRVSRARTLLEAGQRPAEVAARVGFADQAHLTRWFRRVVGVTPGTFRNSVQDSVGGRDDTGIPHRRAEER
jgi:AraC-like DNA-binding protein